MRCCAVPLRSARFLSEGLGGLDQFGGHLILLSIFVYLLCSHYTKHIPLSQEAFG
nr:MAG TPA: hypothetical protein [Caudoviricetes sp.]